MIDLRRRRLIDERCKIIPIVAPKITPESFAMTKAPAVVNDPIVNA